jgi:hypothetical protein
MIDKEGLLEKIRTKIEILQFSSDMLESMLIQEEEEEMTAQDYRALLSVYKGYIETIVLLKLYTEQYPEQEILKLKREFEKTSDRCGEIIVKKLTRDSQKPL